MSAASEGKESNVFSKMRNNPWMISTVVLGLVVLILLFMKAGSGISAASEKNVAEDVISYLNSRVSDGSVELNSISKENGLYKISVSYQGQVIQLYATPDGKNLVSDIIPLDGSAPSAGTSGTGSASNGGVISIDTEKVKDAPVLGNANAPVTIYEFSDYQCPFCRKFWDEAYEPLKKDYIDTGKVRLVFLDFPLSFHPGAIPYAEAARCVREKGGDSAYWKMHDKIFSEQQILDGGTVQSTITYVGDENVKKWATQIGYSINDCFGKGKYTSAIQADEAYGIQILDDGQGVGTPTFVVNGVKLEGAQPYASFKQVIDAQLVG